MIIVSVSVFILQSEIDFSERSSDNHKNAALPTKQGGKHYSDLPELINFSLLNVMFFYAVGDEDVVAKF